MPRGRNGYSVEDFDGTMMIKYADKKSKALSKIAGEKLLVKESGKG